MSICPNPPCVEVGPFRYCPIKGCGWMEEPAPKPSLDEFAAEVVDRLPPDTWEITVWAGDDMRITGRIDPADARRIVATTLTTIRDADG